MDLQLEAVTIGYVFKAEFWLPENASSYLSFLDSPFDVTTYTPLSPAARRKRELELQQAIDNGERSYDNAPDENFEKHEGQIEVETGKIVDPEQDKWDAEKSWFEDDEFDRSKNPIFLRKPQNYATSRWSIYKGFAALAERYDTSHIDIFLGLCTLV